MSGTVTVSTRSLALAAVALLVVAAAYSIGAARADTSAAQPVQLVAAPQPENRAGASQIAVTGTGTVTGVPDQLRLSLSAHGSAADVSSAVAGATIATRRVLAALREHRVARGDTQTTGLDIHAVYDYSGDERRLTGYAATERMSVLLRDLKTAGEAISAAVEAGGNAVRVHDMGLEVGDQGALLAQARAEAFAQAKAKAEQYAEAAGRELGELTSVRESVGRPRRGPVFAARDVALEAARLGQVPIRAGSEELRVSVSLVWSFA